MVLASAAVAFMIGAGCCSTSLGSAGTEPATGGPLLGVHGFGQDELERLAAQEVARYWRELSGGRAELGSEQRHQQEDLAGRLARRLAGSATLEVLGPQVVVATQGHPIHAMLGSLDGSHSAAMGALGTGSDHHLVRSLRLSRRGSVGPVVVCAGATPRATLYAAYSLLEHLGARFYLHGDVLPAPNAALQLPLDLSRTFTPRFAVRGLNPFHDFGESSLQPLRRSPPTTTTTTIPFSLAVSLWLSESPRTVCSDGPRLLDA